MSFLTKAKETVGRKLASLIGGPILIAGLSALNAFLPDASQWSPEQMKEIAEWILGTVMLFIGAQGTVDTVKAKQAPAPIQPVPAIPTQAQSTIQQAPVDINTIL